MVTDCFYNAITICSIRQLHSLQSAGPAPNQEEEPDELLIALVHGDIASSFEVYLGVFMQYRSVVPYYCCNH